MSSLLHLFLVQVYALSHGLLSEPHISFTGVYPNPIRNLSVVKVQDNTVTLTWEKPLASLFTGYMVRYRALGADGEPAQSWTEITDVGPPPYNLAGLTHGEEFEIEVNSVSHHVPSTSGFSVIQTIGPQAVQGVEPILGAEDITLEWPKPEGRIDVYYVKWYPLSNPEDIRTKTIPGDASEREAKKISILIPDLHPGVDYMFEIVTEAHQLKSDTVRSSIRTMPLITSEVNVINKRDSTTSLTIRYTPTPLTRSLFDTYR